MAKDRDGDVRRFAPKAFVEGVPGATANGTGVRTAVIFHFGYPWWSYSTSSYSYARLSSSVVGSGPVFVATSFDYYKSAVSKLWIATGMTTTGLASTFSAPSYFLAVFSALPTRTTRYVPMAKCDFFIVSFVFVSLLVCCDLSASGFDGGFVRSYYGRVGVFSLFE